MGTEDPYATIKTRSNTAALHALQQLDHEVDLAEALRLAIAANNIDFGTNRPVDLTPAVLLNASDLTIDDSERLQTDLERAGTVMVVGDNTGEIIFDALLLRTLHRLFPTKELVYAVRGGPAINDATLADARLAKIDEVARIVEGSRSPGVIFEEASQAWRDAYHAADVVLAKGQGNFESLVDKPKEHGTIYFLLKAKCALISTLLGVTLGDSILGAQDRFAGIE
jgi:uncharacterized protein with ATP-grasp and redox domains